MLIALLYLVVIIFLVFLVKKYVLDLLRQNKNVYSFVVLYAGYGLILLFIGIFMYQLVHIFIEWTDVFYRK